MNQSHSSLMFLKEMEQLAYERGFSLPIISSASEIQANYLAMRLNGESHKTAEMLAFAQPPQSRTDREFLRGHCNGNQFAGMPAVGDYYKSIARQAGQDPVGKVYMHSLARFPGDPQAWIAGRGDVQRLVEDRGWSCEGSVNVKAREPDREIGPSRGGLASDLVDEKVAQLSAEPEFGWQSKEALREQVLERYAPAWSKSEVANVP